jgi:hypothetical protein
MRAWGAAVASGHLALGLAGWLLLGVPPWFDGGGPPPGPEDPEPPWWPEFERELRAYMDARERTPA